MNQKSKIIACPCGNKNYAQCCGRFIDDGQIPVAAADLMRSRYTAYALRNETYLRATWWPDTLPEEALTREQDVKWIGLEILGAGPAATGTADAGDPDHTTVEFIARFKVGGKAHKLHEISNFRRQPDTDGTPRWYYVDGVFPGHG